MDDTFYDCFNSWPDGHDLYYGLPAFSGLTVWTRSLLKKEQFKSLGCYFLCLTSCVLSQERVLGMYASMRTRSLLQKNKQTSLCLISDDSVIWYRTYQCLLRIYRALIHAHLRGQQMDDWVSWLFFLVKSEERNWCLITEEGTSRFFCPRYNFPQSCY